MAGPGGEDVVEGGAPPPRRTTRALALILAAVLIGYIVYSAIGSAGTRKVSRPPTPTTPGSPQPGTWPSGRGPCGTVLQPIVDQAEPGERGGESPTGQLLVGAAGLTQVDLATGSYTHLRGLRDREVPVDLAPGRNAIYVSTAKTHHCATSAQGGLYRVTQLTSRATAVQVSGRPARILTGPHGLWAVRLPDGPSGTVALTALAHTDGASFRLPPDEFPVADTVAGIVVDDVGPKGPRLLLVDTAGDRLRQITRGISVAVTTAGEVLTADDHCVAPRAPGHCTLSAYDLRTGADLGSFTLPAGTSFTSSPAVFSADGGKVALVVNRRRHDPRLSQGYPADVAVLDLDTGDWTIVSGLELPPDPDVGLAFDSTGRWVVAALDFGSTVQIFGWRPGLSGVVELAVLTGGAPLGPVAMRLPDRSSRP